jgi:hypothetical protein
MTFYAGHNFPGHLPEVEPSPHFTYDGAKRALIDDLEDLADEADLAGKHDLAETISAIAEDVNLWSRPDTISVGDEAYWIITDEEYEES